jgi:hypothetical protein
MKILSLLAIVQITLVLLLFAKLDSLESRVNELSSPPESASENTVATAEVVEDEATSGLDARVLRRIVREELLAARSSQEAGDRSAAENEPPMYDEAEMQYRRELVIQEIEYLKEQVDVSTAELEQLMGNIAQLDPARRTELMGLLNQAMNRGEIRGKL